LGRPDVTNPKQPGIIEIIPSLFTVFPADEHLIWLTQDDQTPSTESGQEGVLGWYISLEPGIGF
jgi:hypothetical protein